MEIRYLGTAMLLLHLTRCRLVTLFFAYVFWYGKELCVLCTSWLSAPSRTSGRVETESDGTRWRTEGEVKGKEANGVGSQQFSVWLGTVHPVLLQSFSPDPHSKKASTRLNWQPRRYKWTGPFRWNTESGFCACAITSIFHSTTFQS